MLPDSYNDGDEDEADGDGDDDDDDDDDDAGSGGGDEDGDTCSQRVMPHLEIARLQMELKHPILWASSVFSGLTTNDGHP